MLASIVARNVMRLATARVAAPLARRSYAEDLEFHDTVDLTDGFEKQEILCRRAGNYDPWNILPVLKGPGTKDCPTMIPSAFDSRMVICDCNSDFDHVTYLWVHSDQPRQCRCGHYYQLYKRETLKMP